MQYKICDVDLFRREMILTQTFGRGKEVYGLGRHRLRHPFLLVYFRDDTELIIFDYCYVVTYFLIINTIFINKIIFI